MAMIAGSGSVVVEGLMTAHNTASGPVHASGSPARPQHVSTDGGRARRLRWRRMTTSKPAASKLETVEPIGKRVLIRKDEDKKQTRSGIHLPDKIEIPTLTGRIVSVSAEVAADSKYPVEQYDRVLFNPKEAIPVDFEGDNRLFVVPVENIVAVFRKA